MVKRLIAAAVTVAAGILLGVGLAVAGHSPTAAAASPKAGRAQPAAPPSSQTSQSSVAGNPATSAGSQTAKGYFIKEYNGHVSVMRSGSDQPEMIFDISTKMLPELDRKQLSDGIYVETYEELVRLIEDYIS
ncbi:MAG: hypothetical protein RR276_04835 [Angelakisella sp.]